MKMLLQQQPGNIDPLNITKKENIRYTKLLLHNFHKFFCGGILYFALIVLFNKALKFKAHGCKKFC